MGEENLAGRLPSRLDELFIFKSFSGALTKAVKCRTLFKLCVSDYKFSLPLCQLKFLFPMLEIKLLGHILGIELGATYIFIKIKVKLEA